MRKTKLDDKVRYIGNTEHIPNDSRKSSFTTKPKRKFTRKTISGENEIFKQISLC